MSDLLRAEDETPRQAVEALLARLVGLRCSGYTAGGAAGSHVNLEFGGRIPRAKPLENEYLTEEQRLGEPEYSVFVLCVWRLDSDEQVICGAWDDNGSQGPMLRGLEELPGWRLGSFEVDEPGLDLRLRFENGWTFRIFCDQVNEQDECPNYSLFSPEEILTVKTRSRLVRAANE